MELVDGETNSAGDAVTAAKMPSLAHDAKKEEQIDGDYDLGSSAVRVQIAVPDNADDSTHYTEV